MLNQILSHFDQNLKWTKKLIFNLEYCSVFISIGPKLSKKKKKNP